MPWMVMMISERVGALIESNFNKYYIDFCSRNNIEYHSVIGNRSIAWYQNDGVEYQPGPNTDVTKPKPGLEIKEIFCGIN